MERVQDGVQFVKKYVQYDLIFDFISENAKFILKKRKYQHLTQLEHDEIQTRRKIKRIKSTLRLNQFINENLDGKDNFEYETNLKEKNQKEINENEVNRKEINVNEVNPKEINEKEVNRKGINEFDHPIYPPAHENYVVFQIEDDEAENLPCLCDCCADDYNPIDFEFVKISKSACSKIKKEKNINGN